MKDSDCTTRPVFPGVGIVETETPARSARAKRRFAHSLENPKEGEAAFDHLHRVQKEIGLVRGLAAVIAKCRFKDPSNAQPFLDVETSLTALIYMLDDPPSVEFDMGSPE